MQDAISGVPKANRSSYTKHKAKKDFNPLKFTPSKIHNKINISSDELVKYFLNNHPISECAKNFGCSQTTIKRKLRLAAVDTSIYNHSIKAKELSRQARAVKTPSDEELWHMLVDDNLDTKTVAESCGVHFNTIRKAARRLGIRKDRKAIARSMSSRHHRMFGCSHPAQRPDVLAKTRKSTGRVRYVDLKERTFLFRSLHELSYALLLDHNGLEWYYEELRIPYVDMMTGKWRIYVVDFTTICDDLVEWIEVKPNDKMIPCDKWIYASRRAEDADAVYRGLTKEERIAGWELLKTGYRKEAMSFCNQPPRQNAKQISYWFSNLDAAREYNLSGWHKHSLVSYSQYLHTLKLRCN